MLVKPEYEKIMKSIFKIVAPGQPLRIAIERIQEASLGGLLILSSIESIEKYVDGGFVLNTAFSPQKVYELAKMDGAVLISEDLKTIYGANVQLQPDKEIQTDESGTRHRTADRIAKLTNKLVITISERRKRITVFKGDFKYILDLVGDLLTKASQAIMSLEKYAISVNKYMEDLTLSEFENTVILEEVLNGLRYFYLMFIMDKEVNQYIMELGNEGRLIELQHHEIMANQRITFNNFVKDYTLKISKSPEKIFDELMKLEKDEIREDAKIAKILGYDLKQTLLDETLESKGYRILSSANKLTKKDVENIVDHFKNLKSLLSSGYDEIYSIKGMGKFKTERVLRMKEKFENKY
ncbi:DNA integrity scanning diadenylate cyclase DisA [Pseudostreptobacillus hongkongensis]|uniref:DNA integrity scanning diadenylate cyclase DisA n=1 Tax=Pseudostreptobacillus hongkongensis TaxID=1162717 RepID=UPI000830E38F|nr:DNA integrity scanning diadenylate cyclase DisA [Pseudostreptobacillus hongkongensis]